MHSPREGAVLAPGRRGEVPARLGRYQLVRRIAVGGTSEVYLARAQTMHGLSRDVVVKRLVPRHDDGMAHLRLLLSEARVAFALQHPNIATVYDVGEERGIAYLAMEFVHGRDLRELTRRLAKRRRGLPLEHAVGIVSSVAAALDHAHRQVDTYGRPLEIVHRDVSPSNVLVSFDGGVKLVDFGIAKTALPRSSTAAGTIKGKIPYMSPEQARGRAVDRRSDVFSLGILLWELTTGQVLYGEQNELAILTRIADEDAPRPSTRVAGYPADLEAIVMKALRRDRDDRYQSARALWMDLERFAREHRLAVSSLGLGELMRDLFAIDLERDRLELEHERARLEAMSQPREMEGGGGIPTTRGSLEQGRAGAVTGSGPVRAGEATKGEREETRGATGAGRRTKGQRSSRAGRGRSSVVGRVVGRVVGEAGERRRGWGRWGAVVAGMPWVAALTVVALSLTGSARGVAASDVEAASVSTGLQVGSGVASRVRATGGVAGVGMRGEGVQGAAVTGEGVQGERVQGEGVQGVAVALMGEGVQGVAVAAGVEPDRGTRVPAEHPRQRSGGVRERKLAREGRPATADPFRLARSPGKKS